MPYIDKEYGRKKALEYYYKHRKRILKHQIERLNYLYKHDKRFRHRRQLRDKSRIHKTKLIGYCTICKDVNDLQRHHSDYRSTKIIILCRKCHNKIHNKIS